eukprot:3847705-Prymnesium_polylepis.2
MTMTRARAAEVAQALHKVAQRRKWRSGVEREELRGVRHFVRRQAGPRLLDALEAPNPQHSGPRVAPWPHAEQLMRHVQNGLPDVVVDLREGALEAGRADSQHGH